MGTLWIHAMRAVVLSYHHCQRFPSSGVIFTIKWNQKVVRSCFITEKKLRSPPIIIHSIIEEKDSHHITKTKPLKSNTELVDMININPSHPHQQIEIGAQLHLKIRKQLENFL